jgi:hypothetical protein
MDVDADELGGWAARATTLSELLTVKLEIDDASRDAQFKLAEAKRQAYVHRRFLPPEEFAQLELRARALKRQSQRAQVFATALKQEAARKRQEEISRTAAGRREEINRVFVGVARELLAPDTYEMLMREAMARLDQ